MQVHQAFVTPAVRLTMAFTSQSKWLEEEKSIPAMARKGKLGRMKRLTLPSIGEVMGE